MTSRGRGCSRFGCWGCTGLLVIFAVVAGVTVQRIASRGAPPLQREQPTLEWPLPADLPGVLILDMRQGTFKLQPGPAGEPLRVEADYDASLFKLESVGSDTEDGWERAIEFGARSGWTRTLGRTARNSVTVTVPQGQPFVLRSRMGVGRSRLELAGLSVTEIDLVSRTGQHELIFSQPLSRPLTRLNVEGSTSSLYIGSLGNASPREIHLVHRMGRLDLDLRGAWQFDAIVSGRVSLGDLFVRLPDGAEADFGKCTVQVGDRQVSEPVGLSLDSGSVPKIEVDIDVSFGDLTVR